MPSDQSVSHTAARTVSIRPGVGMLAVFPHVRYQAWYALAELVDNALESFLRERESLEAVDGRPARCVVDIALDSDGTRLIVRDNAGGIASGDLDRALKPAAPPPDTTGLSQFGMGMKSASCWFSPSFSIRTSALGEPVEREINIDVARLVELDDEVLDVLERPAAAEDHFTELVLRDLYKPLRTRTIGKIKEHLSSIYRVFLIRGDLQITSFGDELWFDPPAVLEARSWDDPSGPPVVWRKPISIVLDDGISANGYAALRARGSTREAGFALFKNDRLVQGSADEAWRPPEVFGGPNTYRSQRLFGELHLEGLDVAFSKDGFIWGEREEEFLDKLREKLDEGPLRLLQQAENYRALRQSDDQLVSAERAVARTADAVARSSAAIERQVEAGRESPTPTELAPVLEPFTQSRCLTVLGRQWEVTIEAVNDGQGGEWLRVSNQTSAGELDQKIRARVSLTHPFMLQFAGASGEFVEPLLRLAAALAVAECAARAVGVRDAGKVRRIVNELVAGELAHP